LRQRSDAKTCLPDSSFSLDIHALVIDLRFSRLTSVF